jgi:hypothetical protein
MNGLMPGSRIHCNSDHEAKTFMARLLGAFMQVSRRGQRSSLLLSPQL